MPSFSALYAEAARFAAPVAIETHVHLLSEHVGAGRGARLALAEPHERVVDDEWIALKPKWERYRDHRSPSPSVATRRATSRRCSRRRSWG